MPVVVYADPRLSENTQLALVSAIDEMNQIVGRTVFLLPRGTVTEEDLNGVNGLGAVFVTATEGPQTVGITRHMVNPDNMKIVNALVWLPNTGDYRSDYQFALHELGHVLGLDHDDIENSLMAPQLKRQEQRQDLTNLDRIRLRRQYGVK